MIDESEEAVCGEHRDVDAIVGLARTNGYDRIVWLTLRANVSYESPGDAGYAEVFERNNATLAELASARASSVLPVPGGPWNSTPRGGVTWNF